MNEIFTNKLEVLKSKNEKLVCKLEILSHDFSLEQKKFEIRCTPIVSGNELFKSKV